jgi:hypothetical protein
MPVRTMSQGARTSGCSRYSTAGRSSRESPQRRGAGTSWRSASRGSSRRCSTSTCCARWSSDTSSQPCAVHTADDSAAGALSRWGTWRSGLMAHSTGLRRLPASDQPRDLQTARPAKQQCGATCRATPAALAIACERRGLRFLARIGSGRLARARSGSLGPRWDRARPLLLRAVRLTERTAERL